MAGITCIERIWSSIIPNGNYRYFCQLNATDSGLHGLGYTCTDTGVQESIVRNSLLLLCPGKIAAGNLKLYLPFLLKEIQANPKRQYLLLHSLKEVHRAHAYHPANYKGHRQSSKPIKTRNKYVM